MSTDGPILHGMQEVREFDSPRLHQKLQARADVRGQEGRLPRALQLSLRELYPRLDVELEKGLVQVVLDRAGADEELSRDLFVALPLRSEACDL